jgi:hypothetical protein
MTEVITNTIKENLLTKELKQPKTIKYHAIYLKKHKYVFGKLTGF